MAGVYNFFIEQGATVDFRLDYKDSAGSPVDLTDYHAKMQIRNAPGGSSLYATLSSSLSPCGSGLNLTPKSGSLTLPKTSGSIGVKMSAATSSAFTFVEAYYDVEIISGSGTCKFVDRILQGKVKLSKEVTT